MKYSQCLSLTLALVSASAAAGWSQAPPENWLKPRKTQITRDAAGLATIQKSLAAMNPPSLPGIADASVEFSVSEWAGRPASGTCRETSIGVFSQSRSVVIDGNVVDHSLLKSGVLSSKHSDGSVSSVSDKRALEQIPLLPPILLQEVLINALDQVEVLPNDASALNETVVRVTIRPSTWKPETRDLNSASLDLYFDSNTHLLNRILGFIHTEGNPRNAMPHEIIYSQYQRIQSVLIPQIVEERLVGKSLSMFVVKNVAFNQGLKLSNLQ